MEEKKLTDEALKGLNDFHDRILKTRIAELIRESEIMAIVNAKKVIVEQKAEIERLTEENEYLDGCAKQFLADYQKCEVEVAEIQKQAEAWKARVKELEQAWEVSSSNEIELQEQVDELTAKNENLKYSLDTANNYIEKLAQSCETNCKKFNGITTQQAVKDTAKEILGLILAKEFEKGDYLTDDELKNLFAEKYGVGVE